jgi:hypothetical protein
MRLTALLFSIALLAPVGVHAADAPRLNAMHVLGSHNSYRPDLDPSALARQRQVMGDHSFGVEYGHPPIAKQLDLGLRQLEFDPYADGAGGLYAAPYFDQPDKLATMRRPGAKVLHAPVVDARTLCLTLAACFDEVAAWSRAHPDHAPIVIFVNTKEDPFNNPAIPNPPLYTAADLASIDADAVAAFGRNHIVAPDDLRGRAATLRQAATTGGWPSLAAARGKVLLVLDSNPRVAQLYRQDHPSLKGRMMFGLYDVAEPEAAVFNVQDPKVEEARIKDLVAAGFLVRTRSDADTREARLQDHSRLQAAVRSGAQIISSDYYPGAPDPLGLGFVVSPPWFDTIRKP